MEAFEKLMNDCAAQYEEYLQANPFRGFDFLKDVEKDIENVKNGIMKITFLDNGNDKSKEETSVKETSKISAMNLENVKLERISEDLFESALEMPPPRLPMKRGRKVVSTIVKSEPTMRCTRSKTRTYNKDDTISKPKAFDRDSDVVLQKDNVSLITLTDSDDENKSSKINVEPTSAATNLKQIKKEKLSGYMSMSEDNECKSKDTHSKKTLKKRKTKKKSSVYEDCVSICEKEKQNESEKENEKQNDATFTAVNSQPINVISTPKTNNVQVSTTETNTDKQEENQIPDNVNTTYSKPVGDQTFVKTTTETKISSSDKDNIQDLMTDDESIHENNEVIKIQMSTVVKKSRVPIFSPYENSPVKNRVAAFEKLQANDTTGCPTVTNTGIKAKHVKQNGVHSVKNFESELKLNYKTTPQMTAKFLPSYTSSSASKVMSHSSLHKDLKQPLKSATAVKTSQQEYREREKRRKEKESMIRKQEELRQQEFEEKKRRREERHLKAQQAREEQEKSKQKLLEMQKLKAEKYKQACAEKQERLEKQREEAERRRMLAMQKALKEKRKEEREKAKEEEALKKDMKQKINNKMYNNQPVYMIKKAPLLSTIDCYDSDDPDNAKVKPLRPPWQQSNNMMKILSGVRSLRNIEFTDTFFCCQSQTPDLRDIFENIDPKKLKRNSSAIWQKAPIFTMMHVTDSFNENDENED